MSKSKTVKIIAGFVSLTGFLVAVGWVFNIGLLEAVSFKGIIMRFSVALCFIAGGIMLYSTIENQEKYSFVAQIILPSVSLFILLLMATSFVSIVVGIDTGFDVFFIQQKVGSSISEFSFGRAPIPVLFGFILIAVSGMLIFTGFKKHLFWLGLVLIFIGGVAVLGYAIDQQMLYYLVPGVSTAMSFLAAPLFILCGVGFILCGKIPSKQN